MQTTTTEVDYTIADLLVHKWRRGPRCGFCRGLKNKERKLFFIKLRNQGVDADTIEELKKETCSCWKLWN